MITLNEKADIFIFQKKHIVVLLNGKIIKIGGEDAWVIAELFRELYCNKRYMKEIAEILGRKKLSSDDRKSILSLKNLGVIVDIKNNKVTTDSCLIRPFTVFPLQNGIWYFRNKEKVYYFIASTYVEAKQKMENILLSCADEDDLDLLAQIDNQVTEYLGRRFHISQNKVSTMLTSLEGKDIGILNMANNKCHYVKGSFTPNETSEFWKELEKRSVGETRIIPSLKRAQDNGLPFKRSKIVYLSFHKITQLDGRITDFQIGIDDEAQVAKGKAIMEAIERYCGRKPIEESLVFDSLFGLGLDSAIAPGELWNFSGQQFSKGWLKNITAFSPKDIIPWIEVKNILNGKSKYAPLSFVTYANKMAGHYPFNFMANSNGMAAHISLDSAVKKGALEVIERDAILIYWFNRISPRQIVLNGHREVDVLVDKLENLGYQLYLVDLTLDTVPVIMAIAFAEEGILPFFCGAAAAESKIEAINKAIEELEFTLWSRLKYIRDTKRKVKAISPETIKDPVDHEALYLKPEMIGYLKFLFRGEVYKIEEDELLQKTDLYSILADRHLELYYADMNVKEVRDLNLGIEVVKAIIPGFVPITFGYGQEPLKMRRIYDIPIQLGFRNKKITEGELINNYLPHFFS